MKHTVIDQVLQRAQIAKSDSDFTYFFSVLLAGEALAKTAILGLIAAIGDDKDRNRYRLEHSLARSDGLGDWGKAIEDALTGPASQYLLAEARAEQTELTRLCRPGDWQFDSVNELKFENADANGEMKLADLIDQLRDGEAVASHLKDRTPGEAPEKRDSAHHAKPRAATNFSRC